MKPRIPPFLWSLISCIALVPHTILAGFDLPDSADGEALGRPPRSNPAYDPAKPEGPGNQRELPEDPIDPGVRQTLSDQLAAKYRDEVKQDMGAAALAALTPAQQDAEFEKSLQEIYDAGAGAGSWAALPAATRTEILTAIKGDPGAKAEVDAQTKKRLGCAQFDALTPAQQTASLQAKADAVVIQMIGQAAWNALTPAEKAVKRATIPDDKIRAFRANVALALSIIACIPAPAPNPLGVPTGADVSDCLRKTWDKGRLCVDFISQGASGAVLPNCAGKPAGCDPDNAAINIGIDSFPCRKIERIYEPDFYLLLTTLYHEGIHLLQAFPAKNPAENPLAILRGVAEHELVTHGGENVFIAALCAALEPIIATGVVENSGNPAVQKFLDCLKSVPDGPIGDPGLLRRVAAVAFKAKLVETKLENESALACYQDYINLVKDVDDGPPPTPEEAGRRFAALRWIAIRFQRRLISAGGGSNIIRQTSFDPASGTPAHDTLTVPVDEVTDFELIFGGAGMLVVGNDRASGDGVLYYYADADGDGAFEKATERMLVRDNRLFDGVDIVTDSVNGEWLAVNLISGEIVALGNPANAPPASFDLLPHATISMGMVDLQNQPGGRVVLSPNGRRLSVLPGLATLSEPILVPGQIVPIAERGEFPEFSPVFPNREVFELWGITPVFVQAGGLPVHDTTSTINQFTRILTISGSSSATVQVIVQPPGQPQQTLPPVILGHDGRGSLTIQDALLPGTAIMLRQGTNGGSPSYLVRDATARLTQPSFDPATAQFAADLSGVPGMPYQPLFSPDLALPFQPLGPPVIAGEVPLRFSRNDLPPGRGFITVQPLAARGP